MPIPIPPNYGEIKVPFNQLSEEDFFDGGADGRLERIVRRGYNQNYVIFVLTESGRYFEAGYGVKKDSILTPSN